MKYLKTYKVFEEIHPLNTNINELDENFVSNIIDICADLNDQFPQSDSNGELVSFYSSRFRNRLYPLHPTEYPSISISMPHSTYGYTFGNGQQWNNTIAIECVELKEVALRIKEFLGDAYIGFVVGDRTFQLDNNSPKLFTGINGFQIVYDPNKL
jgi:hypothetical protein